MTIRTKVTIPAEAAESLLADLDDAIRRRSVDEIRIFSREAELSGMDQAASRGREIANVIEHKAKAAGRVELTKIKASLKAASEPDWAAEFDRQQMAKMLGGGPFSVNDHEAHEAERIQAQNRQLAERNRRHEEQRRAQVAGDEPEPEPWWRR